MKSLLAIKDDRYIEIPYERSKAFSQDNGYDVIEFDNDTVNEYLLTGSDHITISSDVDSDIVVEMTDVNIVIEGDTLRNHSNKLFYNGTLTRETCIKLSDGDELIIGRNKFIWNKDHIRIIGSEYSSNLQFYVESRKLQEEYPKYSRSARKIKREPEDTVDVSNPPNAIKASKGSLLKTILPPLVMVVAMVAVGVIMGRGIYMYVMVLSSVVTTCFSVTNYFSDKKENKKKEEQRVAKYENYLLGKRKELDKLYNIQKEALLYQNLTSSAIQKELRDNSNRLYERSSTDGDFMEINIGKADRDSSFKVKYNNESLNDNDDPFLDEMRALCRAYSKIEDMPVNIDLKTSHMALIGEKRHMYCLIREIVAQLAFFQSYHDIEFVVVTEEEDRSQFDWMRWYPHCRLKAINVTGIIDSDNVRDQVLGHLTQVMKGRQEQLDESKKDTLFLPYYIFIIDSPKKIVNNAIMEYLQKSDMALGYRLIYLSNLENNVPENVKTTVIVNDFETAKVRLLYGELVNRDIKLHDSSDVDFEMMARLTAPIEHYKGVTSHIPESITFFEMYGIKTPEQLPIQKLWQQNCCHKTLSVPLGVRGENDIVSLNLHEKAHGPHGLIAGTTGSGKSELVQSYILSLAINFSPYEVGFLLIDYKGGGMANLFADLPHLLGTITNLDGSESIRALTSIKAELSRRQMIFFKHNINNINQYTKMFRAGEVEEPLPHLFIISDEFAELKKEQPEFMSELVSTARIGRSLGVHLILATQKPGGVVDDQIWSNSKFRIALKVQNESDSKDVLKTPDAAHIVQTGRAYLQVGNNEIYELFQSAWSGAPYRPQEVAQGFDSRVYKINKIGQGELLNEDLSDGADSHDTKLTQLDVTVQYIKEQYASIKTKNVTRPWIPALKEKIITEYIADIEDVGTIEDYDPAVQIGVVDIPEEQKQEVYIHDFFRDGNMAVFASSGYGKSTLLTNMALTLASKNSPELLNFYLMDYGNSALVPLRKLPHTADYITLDDAEKRNKLTGILVDEIKKRKSLFAKQGAINFKMYNQMASKKLPMIVIFIDNYDAVKELGLEYENFIGSTSRDGVGLGIYMVLTASRAGAIKYSIINNFKHKLALYLYESADMTAVVGRTKYKLPEVKGRAFVKQADVNIMQCYLPVAYEDDISYIKSISAIVDRIVTGNTAPKAKCIPILPETVTPDLLTILPETSHKIAIGLDCQTVETVYIDLSIKQFIVGGAQTGKTNALKCIIEQLSDNIVKYVFDSKAGDLLSCKDKVNYYSSTDSLVDLIQELGSSITARNAMYEMSSKEISAVEFYKGLDAQILLIEDVENFILAAKGKEHDLSDVLRKARDVGIGVVFTCVPGKLRGFDDLTRFFKDVDSGIVLGRPTDQTYFNIRPDRTFVPKTDIGFLVERGRVNKVMLLNSDEM
ncbi:DNA segregation ATPase FtsK/SpoIIIE, S-DNA-T family [Oscillospiraceae bacterium]|nr:DNA segregation ATPase FtsK/SpoIIIE, S-DNA-T family [Oscillospiraceae bacterium]